MDTAPQPQGGHRHRAATQPAPPPSIAHRVVNDDPLLEHYRRQDDGSWRFTETDSLEATIPVPSIEAELPLAEIYLDVFEEENSSESGSE